MEAKAENLRQLFGELFDRVNLTIEGKAKGQAGRKAGEQAKQYRHAN